jgi:hypothetical protein
MSQELVERIRKRKCFADKDLEKLAPNPNEETISINSYSKVTQETHKRQKLSLLQNESSFYIMNNNENTQNNFNSNISNSYTFDPVSPLKTLNTIAAYYTHLLHLNSSLNLLQIPQIPSLDKFQTNSESRKSAFYEPETKKNYYPNEKEKIQNVSGVNFEINNLQCLNQHFLANEKINSSKSFLTKDHTTESIQKTNKKPPKFSNFSVEALLGSV